MSAFDAVVMDERLEDHCVMSPPLFVIVINLIAGIAMLTGARESESGPLMASS